MTTAPGRRKSLFFSAPVYPFLLAVYPALSMLANNVGELRPAAAVRALLVSLAVCVAVFSALYVLMRDRHRAAFVTGIWLFLFFSYGHLQILLPNQGWTRLGILFPIWIGTGFLSLLLAWRARPNLRGLSMSFNGLFLLLAGMSIWQFVSYDAKLTRLLETPPPSDSLPLLQVEASSPLPDVYYIVLDSYTRSDTLQNVYGYDNSQFISELEEMGFYVARCSQSNYDRTELAFASTLNLDYLQTIDPSLTSERTDKSPLWGLIRNSRLLAALEKLGYQTVAFATGYPWSELVDADRYIQPELKWNDLNEFEVLLLRTSLMRAAQEAGLIRYDTQEFDRQSERSRLTLDTLSSLPDKGKPRFIFVHLLEPHPPFVFDAEGNSIDAGQFINEKGKYTPESYARGYVGEMQYINQQILRTVRTLIEKSAIQPILIIQGDHGPWFQPPETVLTILNAYYLPGHSDALYPSISPVNTFRAVLDEYFGAYLPLLEDVNYNSPDTQPYNYEVVPNICE
jgi:hypothetical protein